MNSIPKFMASVVVIMIAVLVCISLIFAGITVSSARTHHNNVISMIEDSNFDKSVIDECIHTAERKGYALAITKEINASSTECYRVALSYDLYLPLFGKVHTGRIVGYAYPGASIGTAADADHYFEIDSKGVLGIKSTYRWATGLEDYASDKGKDVAGSKNDLLPTEITIPTYFDGVKVTALRDYMFANDDKLTKLVFEEGVAKIGKNAFQNCVNLEGEVVAPNSVTAIGEYAFDNCGKLAALKFNEESTLDVVGDYAFQNCVAFKDVALPDSMTENGYAAFKGCVNMTSYKAPFAGGDILDADHSYIGYLFGVEVDDYSYKENNSVVPKTLTKVELTKYVAYYSLYDLDSLTELIIGEDVTKFEPWPFAYCDNLVTVTIPKNVQSTHYGAFSNCKKLKQVIFEEGSKISVLGHSNFEDCSSLVEIEIPNTVREIGAYCFENCDALTFNTAKTGKLPEGVKSIGTGAYKDSDGYESFVVPASVTTIENAAFTRSKKLKELKVASGSKSFCAGEAGELLTLDKKEIVAYPYAGPTSYTVPTTVTTIREDAFWYSENLLGVDFSKATTLSKIDDSAFSQCPDIESSIVLPDSVTYIGAYAFYHAGKWPSFTVGPNVSYFGTYAFYDAGGSGCKYYLTMTTVPTFKSNVFFTNTVSSGTITKNYIYVENGNVKDALKDGTHYRSAYTEVNLAG